jgi:5-oxoprolinase (ATP-hydrolysing)
LTTVSLFSRIGEPLATVGSIFTPYIRFKENHASLFAFSLDLDVEMVNLRASAQEKIKRMETQSIKQGDSASMENALQSTSLVMQTINQRSLADPSIQYYGGRKYNEVQIIDRAHLRQGDVLEGPCVICEVRQDLLSSLFSLF